MFGTPGPDGPQQLFEVLSRCTRLRDLANNHGVTLADDPDSLAVLERSLAEWNTHPPTHPFLEHEIGCYVGTVIVRNSHGARWRVWPNGHPVVQLSSGADLDVFEQVRRCLSNDDRTLTSIYVDAVR